MKKLHLSLFTLLLTLIFNACGLTIQNQQMSVNEDLPSVQTLKHISDMSSVAFEWNSFYNENIQGFLLYKSTPNEPEMKLVATIKNKFQTHYVDTSLEPDTTYLYTMRTFNEFKQISSEGVLIEVKTSPRLQPLPFVQAINGLPNKIKLIWRPHPDLRVQAYEIQRAEQDGNFKTIKELKNRLEAEYIDDDLKPNQNFQYRIFAKTFDGVYSESSQILNSTTKALPPQITHLSATTDLAGRILLAWDSPNFEDFAYYKIYAKNSSLLPFSELARTQNNNYEDRVNEVGKKKEYKITIVDKDGLESTMPEHSVEGKTLDAPLAPSITLTAIVADGIDLGWTPNDDRAVSYTLKRYGGGDVIFKEINETTFKDTTAVQGQSYTYEVISVDSNGIESKPSARVRVGG
ncbi:ferrous iron transporter A [Campylobacter sp. MIT 12-5580]|uniref:fibronectin type III domain-containing protein n=1 Tax=Campylobacter sp. MIT 12-5580 TaxID=2040651 RepID=UPI0010F8C82B|nr:fibronectin type III domain-containing protein [Campylobacter sp. MIT 12-5580]TKX30339.1 ferrous iron transporter A [Campylobacter sp. MIT 12-5580]